MQDTPHGTPLGSGGLVGAAYRQDLIDKFSADIREAEKLGNSVLNDREFETLVMSHMIVADATAAGDYVGPYDVPIFSLINLVRRLERDKESKIYKMAIDLIDLGILANL